MSYHTMAIGFPRFFNLILDFTRQGYTFAVPNK